LCLRRHLILRIGPYGRPVRLTIPRNRNHVAINITF
jgi:hypothetical protein